MKQNLVHIPQVDLKDVEHFWVVGSQYKDGILDQDNLKVDLKNYTKELPPPSEETT